MKTDSVNSSNNLVQIVYQSTSAVVSAPGTTPYDNTIPQNTEGTQIITATITPKNANNLLLIKFTGVISNPGVNGYVYPATIALFQDATANALSATSCNVNWCNGTSLIYSMTAGTTSATTFKIRIGVVTGGSGLYVNADYLGTRLFGGASNTVLAIFEYSA